MEKSITIDGNSETFAVFARLKNDDLEQCSTWLTLDRAKEFIKNHRKYDRHYGTFIFCKVLEE